MKKPGVIRNTMAFDRVESKFRVRLEMIEERLRKGISRSEKSYYHEIMEESINNLIRTLPDSELMIRESAVYCCEQGIKRGCPQCDPMPGCRSGA